METLTWFALLFFSVCQVRSQCGIPAFTYTIMPGGQVDVTSTSTVSPSDQWYWWWDDGTSTPLTNTSITASKTFTAQGPHVIELGMVSPSCAVAYDSQTVNVTTGPCIATPNLYIYKDSLNPVLTWNIIGGYVGTVVSASWNWGDSNTSVGLYPSHTYSAAGVYNICVTTSVNCGATATTCLLSNIYRVETGSAAPINVNVIPAGSPSSIKSNNKVENTTIDVYPNPSTGIITVKSSVRGNFEIIDQLGQKVQTFEIRNEEDKRINISGLQNGIYYLKTEKGSSGKKIVVAN